MNYNFNYQCIKTAESFGETAYYNICSGLNYTVPWGSVDWTNAIVSYSLGSLFALGIVSLLGGISYEIYRISKV